MTSSHLNAQVSAQTPVEKSLTELWWGPQVARPHVCGAVGSDGESESSLPTMSACLRHMNLGPAYEVQHTSAWGYSLPSAQWALSLSPSLPPASAFIGMFGHRHTPTCNEKQGCLRVFFFFRTFFVHSTLPPCFCLCLFVLFWFFAFLYSFSYPFLFFQMPSFLW